MDPPPWGLFHFLRDYGHLGKIYGIFRFCANFQSKFDPILKSIIYTPVNAYGTEPRAVFNQVLQITATEFETSKELYMFGLNLSV